MKGVRSPVPLVKEQNEDEGGVEGGETEVILADNAIGEGPLRILLPEETLSDTSSLSKYD